MKQSLCTILVLASVIFIVKANHKTKKVKTEFFDQKEDHFDKQNHKKWKMRYMANDEHYEPGGPIFINVGGAKKIEERDLERGHFYDIAKAEKAYMFRTEHRYYGQSCPVELSIGGFLHLTMEQALADLAHFVRHIKETIMNSKPVKVIMKGVEYAGGLVVWFKHLYPELVDGIWSSSSRLISKLHLDEIGSFIYKTIELAGGFDCHDAYKRTEKTIHELMSQIEERNIKKKFNLCNKYSKFNPWDIANIFYEIGDNVLGLIKEQNPANLRIARFCKLARRAVNIAGGVFDFFKYIYRGVKSLFGSKETCNDVSYQSTVARLKNISAGCQVNKDRVELYQKCSQFGWFPTYQSSEKDLVPLDYHIRLCRDVFDQNYTVQAVEAEINRTNAFYGQLLSQVENIFMTQGQFDPWKVVGHMKNIAYELIPWSGVAVDTYSISLKDESPIAEVKNKIKAYIRAWIKNLFV